MDCAEESGRPMQKENADPSKVKGASASLRISPPRADRLALSPKNSPTRKSSVSSWEAGTETSPERRAREHDEGSVDHEAASDLPPPFPLSVNWRIWNDVQSADSDTRDDAGESMEPEDMDLRGTVCDAEVSRAFAGADLGGCSTFPTAEESREGYSD